MTVIENIHLTVLGANDALCDLHGCPRIKSLEITVDGNKCVLIDDGCSEEDIDALIKGLECFKEKMFKERY